MIQVCPIAMDIEVSNKKSKSVGKGTIKRYDQEIVE